MELNEAIEILKEWVNKDREMRHNAVHSDFDEFCEKNCIAIETVLNVINK